jgi:hypothetical protein
VPSLDLRFAESKSLADAVTGQSLVTFTRASTGTYVDSDGLIKTAATNVARFDHNPATGESLGLLVEEARTNLLTYSEQFDNAAWTKSNSTVTANSVVAPDGTTTADKCQEDSVNTYHYSFQQRTYSAGVHTISAYFKAAERSFAWLYLNTGATATAYFNLATGVVGTVSGTGSPTASITSVANGWYRCTLTATVPATVGGAGYGIALADNTPSYTGTTGSGIYVWGAQLEAGAFPTSYIPTTTASVTRSADVASITGSNFSGWYNQSQGTIFCKAISKAEQYLLEIPTTNGANYNCIAINSARAQFVAVDTTTQAGIFSANNSYQLNVSNKVAAAYAQDNFGVTSNGTIVVTDTSGTVATVNLLAIGRRNINGLNYSSSTFDRLTYWPTCLSNPTLQAITQ